MVDNQLLNEIQKLNFKSIAWIYLKKNGDYENQISATRDELMWIPTKGSAAIAKKTKFGDGVDRMRVIMISLDKELLGLYDVMSPIIPTEKVKLKIYVDLKDIACSIPKGNPAGSCLSKEELLSLFESGPDSKRAAKQ
ncbi:MAG: hypothetical protein AABY53_08580 [Bdellovibrionota bacterium]